MTMTAEKPPPDRIRPGAVTGLLLGGQATGGTR